MPSYDVVTARPLELEISGRNDGLNNRINFDRLDTVRDVLDKIRAQLHLKPNVQIVFNNVEGLQGAQQGELLAHERMSKHFPQGGKVRIDTQAPVQSEANMRVQGNMAHQQAKLNNIIAMKPKENDKAAITQNQAYDASRMTNLITDDAKSVIDKLNFD